MSDPHSPLEQGFEPIYSGTPVLVRLITSEEILTVAYHSTNDSRIMLERPIAIVFETTEKSIEPQTDPSFNISRVRTRFERWIHLSDAFIFPVYLDHILTIAPLANSIIEAYIEWADKLYEQTVVFREAQAKITATSPQNTTPVTYPSDTSVDEIRQSYFDYILHNFKPKGRPN